MSKSEAGVSSFHPKHPTVAAVANGRSLLHAKPTPTLVTDLEGDDLVCTGRVAVVVSAPGNTTDWLLDAAEYASQGQLDQVCVW